MEVNVVKSDHGGDDTWSMVDNMVHIFRFYTWKMTPQPKSIIQNVVPLFDDPSRVIHYFNLCPLLAGFWSRFELNFRSIWLWFDYNFIWIWVNFSSILARIWLRFHWFLVNLLSIFSDFLSILSKGLLRISLKNSWFLVDFEWEIAQFYYQFYLNFYLKFHWFFIDFHSKCCDFIIKFD